MSKLVPGNLVHVNCKWALLQRYDEAFHSFEQNPIALFVKKMPRVKRWEREISEAHAIVLHEDKLVPVHCCYLKPIKGDKP